MEAKGGRRELRSGWLIPAIALYFTVFLNLALWRYAAAKLPVHSASDLLCVLSLPAALALFHYLFFTLTFWPYVGKALTAVLLVLSAAAQYYMLRLGGLIDPDTIRTVLETNPRETVEFFTLGGLLWTLVPGVLPAVLLVRTRVAYAAPRRELALRGLAAAGSLAALVVLAAVFYKDYAIVGRNHRELTKLASPANYLSSTVRYARKRLRAPRAFANLNDNARHQPYVDPHHTVLLLVVGETARAANFSLNGYPRPTNPRLAAEDIVNFPDVASAGTATAISLPAMFSHLGRREVDVDQAKHTENLLDILQRAGYSVLWLDNGNGGKGVDARVPSLDVSENADPKYANGGGCYDEVLLDGLADRLRGVRDDTVIVLHMMGSHGPSYHLRYPERFKVFTPACDTAEIQSRPREEIVNTYDNTILYTDHVLAEAIGILKQFPDLEAGLLYVSDHGESLGENGVYLHGLPYAIAPMEQKRVPMILWMSETMRREDHVDYEKLRAAAGGMELSHDHLFHSVLGLLEVNSDLYDERLDFFRGFRTLPLPFDGQARLRHDGGEKASP